MYQDQLCTNIENSFSLLIPKIFVGNSEKDKVVYNLLLRPLIGRYIRFYPLSGTLMMCMRVELYRHVASMSRNIQLIFSNLCFSMSCRLLPYINISNALVFIRPDHSLHVSFLTLPQCNVFKISLNSCIFCIFLSFLHVLLSTRFPVYCMRDVCIHNFSKR